MEGFRATGDYSPANKIGECEANSFQEACNILMCEQYLERVSEYQKSGEYYDPDRWDYDPRGPAYWGCRLFDNEIDARKAFG